ncbi:MAG: alkaline phosphatase family protein [Ginsengibacter sp.]
MTQYYSTARNIILFFFLMILGQTSFAQKIRKVLFVVADGIPADVISKVKTPNLDGIAKIGGFAKSYVGGERGGYSESPTISAVGYNSLLTGTWANKHNVVDNHIAEPNYHYWTIFRYFKNQYPNKKTAVFSTWQDNRTKLIGEGLPATGNIHIDHHFDGLELDTLNYPHDNESQYIHQIDEAVVNDAVEYIKKDAPDLSWVYLQYTDDMGHKYGDSENFYKAVEIMDAQMGKLWEAIQYRQKNHNEEWQIWITTDHGRDAVTGKDHGGQSARERSTWIVTNASDLNDYFKSGKSGIVDIMPSIAQYLNIIFPAEQRMEIDGIPLTGKLYATNFRARFSGGELYLSWRALETKGRVKIWVSTTNHFPKVGKDFYHQRATVFLKDEEATIDLSTLPAIFYKVVIETPGEMHSSWIHVKKR